MIREAWRMLPDSVRDQLPDRLVETFESFVAQLRELGGDVNLARSEQALVAAIARQAIRSRSESDWLALPIFSVDARPPMGANAARTYRLNAIARSSALADYFARRTVPQLAAAQIAMLDALEDAARVNPAPRAETAEQTATRLRPVVYAALGFTPPAPPSRKRPPPRVTPKPPKPEPTPPAPTPPAPVAPSSSLARWLLPAAAVAAVALVVMRR